MRFLLGLGRWGRRRSGRRAGRRPGVEGLEARGLLDAAGAGVALRGATTGDSHGVTVAYEVRRGEAPPASFDLRVYRSADDTLDADDRLVGSLRVAAPGDPAATPTADLENGGAAAEGPHRLTIPLPEGLRPNPEHPYVLVAADGAAGGPPSVVGFRKHAIAVVTHGGLQNWFTRSMPDWQVRLAKLLKAQGYEKVLAYDWIVDSSTPKATRKHGPRLARAVLRLAGQFPAGEPVDVHLIGHSQGTVVNSLAARILERHETPELHAGFFRVTMLDPHPANNGGGGKQYDVAPGPLGTLARWLINTYQDLADDPPVVVPENVDGAEVFYQHTPYSLTRNQSPALYNLWGRPQVYGTAEIHNVTGPGVFHSGDGSITDWYIANVAPTLGADAPFAFPGALDGRAEVAEAAHLRGGAVVTGDRVVTLSGTAAPGVPVRLSARRAGTRGLIRLGEPTATADGSWSRATRPLPPGRYKFFALAIAPAGPMRPKTVLLPTAALGRVVIGTERLPARLARSGR